MSAVLFEHPVSQDWAGWASKAGPRDCKGCGRSFKPNHPRRLFCGQDDCQALTRERTGPQPRTRQVRPREETSHGVFTDMLLELNRSDGPTGQRKEIVDAVRHVAFAERLDSVRELRLALVRLGAATAARALALPAPPPAADDEDDDPDLET